LLTQQYSWSFRIRGGSDKRKENRKRMATEEVRTMWVIFLGSGMVFGAAALALIWIGSRVLLSIRRQQKKFEIEDATYNKVKEAIKEKENKNEK
jgi:hypothetical protein